MKAVIIGIAVVALIAGAGLFYSFNQLPKTPVPDSLNLNEQPADTKEINDSLAIDSNLAIGSDSAEAEEAEHIPYRDYDKSTFNSETGETRILFFYADWCPTCRPVDAKIKANLDKIPNRVEIIKVNYNDEFTDTDERALAAKYEITYQHTFVRIDSADNEVEKWNGGDFNKLLEYVEAFSPSNIYYPITNGPVNPTQ